jgi:hypothetical protein
MNRLDAWMASAADALGVDRSALQRDLLLDLTRDVAHGVARPAAPLTAFLVGLAAGRAGGSGDDVRAACETLGQALAGWTSGSTSESDVTTRDAPA